MATHTISTIYNDGRYVGWPTMARDPNSGRIFVAFSGDRQMHICPYGKLMLIHSDDDGVNWSDARVLADGPLDDRDAGILITSKGTVLINWFTSVAFRGHCADRFPEECARLTDEIVGDELGNWMIRSSDGGENFENEKIPTFTNSPHGPCELSDGSLFYIGCLLDDRETRIKSSSAGFSTRKGIARSFDDGRSWQVTSDNLPVVAGQKQSDYHEYHAVQAENGTIIVHIRNHTPNPPINNFTTWQMESKDNGETWTVPHEIALGGPSHLLKLNDGRLVMSYSYRNEPWSNLYRVSDDHGESWSPPFVFGPAQPPRDMGYPSSVQLGNGQMLSVWYEQTDWEKSELRMARWSFPAPLSEK